MVFLSIALLIIVISIDLGVIFSLFFSKRKAFIKNKFIILMLYFILTFTVFYIGYSEINYCGEALMRSITSTIKVLFGELGTEDIIFGQIDSVYEILAIVLQLSTVIFVFSNVIFLVFNFGYNKIHNSISRKSKVFYIIGNKIKVSAFLNSLSTINKTFINLNLFKKEFPKYVIVNLDDNRTFNVNKEVQYSVLQIESLDELFKKTINFKNKYTQHIVSFIDDEAQNSKILINFSKYCKENQSLDIKLYLPYTNIETTNMYEIYLNLDKKIKFYSYEDIFANQLMNTVFLDSKTKFESKKVVRIVIGNNKLTKKVLTNLLQKDCFTNNQVDYIALTDKPKNLQLLRTLNTEAKAYLPDAHAYKKIKEINILNTSDLDYLEEFVIQNNLGSYDCIQVIIVYDDDYNVVKDFYRLLDLSKNRFYDKDVEFIIKSTTFEYDFSRIINKNNIYTLGEWKNVYTYENIIHSVYDNLAEQLHNVLKPKKQWEVTDLYEKDSSRAAAYSLSHKLNFLGYELVEDSEEIDEKQFINDYEKKFQYDLSYNDFVKEIDENKFKTVRDLIAFLEHERWNIYMLMNGWIKKSLDDTFKEDKFTPKNVNTKNHICITTVDGLYQLESRIKEYNKKYSFNTLSDYFIYDYDVLDNLFSILKKMNYGIKKVRGDE